jgi:hypothetical protein
MNMLSAIGKQAKMGLCVATLSVAGLAAAQFNYSDFGNVNGLTLKGDTFKNGNSIRLTAEAGDQSGFMWHQTKQRVNRGFETTFQFQISNGYGADGFTFAIQNFDGDFEARLGGGSLLGYHGALANSVVIEFDTYASGWWEPLTSIYWDRWYDWWNNQWFFEAFDYSDWGWYFDSDNHIAIHTMGTFPNSAVFSEAGLASGEPNFYLKDNNVHTARVVYDATAHTLSVYLDGSETATAVANINLDETLNLDNGTAWVGFTAATGGAISNHDIHSWSFTPTTYSWSGFLAPLKEGFTHKLGSTIPVKFQLTGDSAGITDLEATATVNGVAVGAFRYDPTDGQYIFNWRTRGMTAGTHTLGVVMGDGEVRTMAVTLR